MSSSSLPTHSRDCTGRDDFGEPWTHDGPLVYDRHGDLVGAMTLPEPELWAARVVRAVNADARGGE